jgi:sugar phosphate isomerase/epimerase
MAFKLAAFADEADGKLTGQIKAMKENGIGLLEIRGVDGENIADISENKAKEIRKRLDDEGIRVWSLGSPYGKIGINDAFEPHLESFKKGLELSNLLGAERIRLFSFYVPSGEEEKYRNAVTDRLGAFVSAAAGTGIILCHENEKGIYGSMAKRCEYIHKTFPEIKAVFDPANYVQCGQDTKEAWDLIAPYVEYMHVKDALADGSVTPAGKGIGNLPYLLKNYKGSVLTIEPHLSVFDGFEKLEAAEKTTTSYIYPTSRIAFDAAVSALKELI